VSFDLMVEPWVPVMFLDGRFKDVSLESLFEQAHDIRRIVGQTPPMTAALHRLILALTCRAYQPVDLRCWTGLWGDDHFPVQNLTDYASRYPRRFDLFDAERPFFQCPAVAAVAASSAAKLVPYRSVGNNTTLFDHTTATDEVVLTPAEAARWLVTLQAYDPGGMKTPYRKEKSSVAAPANDFGVALVEGSNLKETLLLNLMPYHPNDEQPRNTYPEDRPVWEGDPPGPEPDKRVPKGWTDLLTWPSRRVWLGHRQAGVEILVDRVVITPGTRLDATPEDCEWMAAHYRPEVRMPRLTKGAARKRTYGPWQSIRLFEHRGVWRHSQELLLAPSGDGERHRQRPAALDHVARMVARKVVPPDAVYTLRVFGQQLDSNRSVVQQFLEEAVAVPVALLVARYEVAGPVIGHSIELANLVGHALNTMERDYRATSGQEPSGSLNLTYWPRLVEPFDRFLRSLGATLETDESAASVIQPWADTVRNVAGQAAQRWAHSSHRRGQDLKAFALHYDEFREKLTNLLNSYRGYLAGYISFD